MDFPRFLSLLETQSLFFCPSDQLGDPFEGSLTLPQRILRASRDGEVTLEAIGRSDPVVEQRRKRFCVSCWHFSRHESQAMWHIYSHVNKGVAVRTTLGRLKRSMLDYDGPVYLGAVDYSETAANYTSLLARLFLKRRSFAYEKEFRALIIDKSERDNGGIAVAVDPHELFLSVHLSPFCDPWVQELVRRLLSRYGYQCPVRGGPNDIVL